MAFQKRRTIGEYTRVGTSDRGEAPDELEESVTSAKARPNNHIVSPFNNVEVAGTVFFSKGEDTAKFSITSSGKECVRFRLSIYNGKRADGSYWPAVWMMVVMYGDLARKFDDDKVAPQSRIKVFGKLSQWKSSDGTYVTEILADEYELDWSHQ